MKLFNRAHRVIKLTKAGEVFLAETYKTLLQVDESVRAAREAAYIETGRVRLSCPPSALREIIPGIVRKFHQRHPNVKLDISARHTSTTLVGLQEHSIDVGLVRLPVDVHGLDVTPIHQEPFVVCLPPAHRLASKEIIHLADLRNENFIFYQRKWAPGFHDRIMQLFAESGYAPNIVEEIDEMYVAPSLVAAGIGVTILPRMVFYLRSDDVVVRRLSSRAVFSEVGVAARALHGSPIINSLVAISRVVGRQYSRGA